MPVPGGVGYGMFYSSSFFHNFSKGSSIAKTIICPNYPGSGLTDTLYLTSTNRTAKGVESLIWYNGNSQPAFWIYDWSLATPAFVFGLSYGDLGDYLTVKNIHGKNFQAIEIQNQTYYINSTTWGNIVWLVNQTTSTWEQVYFHTYSATSADQKDSHYGSWGPIVETFQSGNYSNVSTIGFSLVYVRGADANNNWTSFQLLDNNNSTVNGPAQGFAVDFLDTNYTFGVYAS